MKAETHEHFWQSTTRGLARRVNFGWWLERWMTWVMAVALGGSVIILFARWLPLFDVRFIWAGIGTIRLLGAITAWLGMRRGAETVHSARIRLEDSLALKTRLSAAVAGVGAWPQPVEQISWPVKLRWHQPLLVCCFNILMLLLAAYIPISRTLLDQKRVIEKPSAALQVQKWLDQLREKKAADEKSIQEVEKKIADILRRPAENWYEHGSLEAAGNLKEQTAESLREMSRNVEEAERAASSLAQAGNSLPQAAKEALEKNLAAAADGLRTGEMRPNEELLQQLQGLDPSQASGLSDEELKQLAEGLRDAMKALQEALENSPEITEGHGKGDGSNEGEGDGEGEGEDGDGKPGNGGLNRGRGDAKLSMKKDATDLNTKNMEKLKLQLDAKRLAPGDMLTVTDGKHKVDQNAYQGAQQSGAAQSNGEGGAAVWQQSLVPAEREALKKYFK